MQSPHQSQRRPSTKIVDCSSPRRHDLENALIAAVKQGDIARCKTVLSAGELDLDYMDNRGDVALHIAAGLGNPELTKLLLLHKAALTTVNSRGKTALSIAVCEGYREVVRILEDPRSLTEDPRSLTEAPETAPIVPATPAAPSRSDVSTSPLQVIQNDIWAEFETHRDEFQQFLALRAKWNDFQNRREDLERFVLCEQGFQDFEHHRDAFEYFQSHREEWEQLEIHRELWPILFSQGAEFQDYIANRDQWLSELEQERDSTERARLEIEEQAEKCRKQQQLLDICNSSLASSQANIKRGEEELKEQRRCLDKEKWEMETQLKEVQRELQQAQLTVDCQTREISTTKTQQKLLEMKYEELQSEMEKLQTSREREQESASNIDLKAGLKEEQQKNEQLLHEKQELLHEKQVLREKVEKEMTENDRLRKLVRMTSENM